MEEDKEWNYEKTGLLLLKLETIMLLMAKDQWTCFSLNREPRYYASLGFDRGIWMGRDWDVSKSSYLRRAGEPAANAFETSWCMSGIWPKLVHDETVLTRPTCYLSRSIHFPIMRIVISICCMPEH